MNFWPDMTLDDYINLKSRVETRMKISVMTSTGDDDLINPEEKGDLEYRKQQLDVYKRQAINCLLRFDTVLQKLLHNQKVISLQCWRRCTFLKHS